MRKLFLALLLTAALALPDISFADQGQEQVITTTVTTAGSGQIKPNARSVVFVFSSGFTGTIQGQEWSGSTDYSLPISAASGDTLGPINYTVSAGTLRIVELRRQ